MTEYNVNLDFDNDDEFLYGGIDETVEPQVTLEGKQMLN